MLEMYGRKVLCKDEAREAEDMKEVFEEGV